MTTPRFRPTTASFRALAVSAALALLGAACRTVPLPGVVQGAHAPRIESPSPDRGSISGIVADSANGYPIVGASVYFTRDSVIGTGPARPRTDLPLATTDVNGGFALRNVPPGEYTLVESDLDHYPLRTVVVVRAGQVRSEVLRPRRRSP